MELLHASAYNRCSIGLAEQGVHQVKDVLRKEGKSTQGRLEEILFFINSHQQGDEGSSAEIFFRRRPRSNLPNSIRRELDQRDLISHRHKRQTKLATAKGHSSRDKFKVGNDVMVQDSISKRWNA